jgi:hypothetical protein
MNPPDRGEETDEYSSYYVDFLCDEIVFATRIALYWKRVE